MKNGKLTRVLVADDSPTIRAYLSAVLESDPDVHVVGEAVDGKEAISQTIWLQPDVVVVDILMPGMNGYEAAREIMKSMATPVIITSSNLDVCDPEISAQALRSGAVAIIPKPRGPEARDAERSARQFADTVKAMGQIRVRRWRGMRPATGAEPVSAAPVA